MSELTQQSAWKALKQHAVLLKKKRITDLFTQNPYRFTQYSIQAPHLTFDYSKNLIEDKALSLLYELADTCGLRTAIDGLFSGKNCNTTQQLPALHTALRAPYSEGLYLNGRDILIDVHQALDQMEEFVTKIQENHWRGATGKIITDIVNLGIGGSDLGPLMAVQALQNYQQNSLKLHFISSCDTATLNTLCRNIQPETTLFIIASKSFTTVETLLNARALLAWMQKTLDYSQIMAHHFVAITAYPEKAQQFGLRKEHILPIWEWVGGRFSLCSCISLALALSIGMPHFRSLLAGAQAMDQHFYTHPWQENIPVLLGLLGVWHRNFLNTQAHVVLPYEGGLQHFPRYLQQLEMESNGKSVTLSGQAVDYQTCPFIFGDSGLNGQHAFYQLFHQGTACFTSDFIVVLRHKSSDFTDTQQHAIASAFSQSKAFMEGFSSHDPHKNLTGNHSSNTLVLEELTPFTLGMLIALYEHKVFVQSVIWQINPFDQWGIHYGKELAQYITPQLNGTISVKTTEKTLDASTQGLIHLYQSLAKTKPTE